MCPGNGTSQCALGIGLSKVPWERDYPMCSGKELANVLCKWDYQMCPGNGTIPCALGMEQSNVSWEWD